MIDKCWDSFKELVIWDGTNHQLYKVQDSGELRPRRTENQLKKIWKEKKQPIFTNFFVKILFEID